MSKQEKKPLSQLVVDEKKDQFLDIMQRIEREAGNGFGDDAWNIIEAAVHDVFTPRDDLFDPEQLYKQMLKELEQYKQPEIEELTKVLAVEGEIVSEAREGRLSPARHEMNVLPLDMFRRVKR